MFCKRKKLSILIKKKMLKLIGVRGDITRVYRNKGNTVSNAFLYKIKYQIR